MKTHKIFPGLVAAALFLFSSCGKSSEAKHDRGKENQAQEKKADACLLTNASDLSKILNMEVKQLGESTYLDRENEFYHYVSLCGYTSSDVMITIRLGKRKTDRDPFKSRDIAAKIQKEDKEKIIFVEPVDINGTPALYYEEKDSEMDLTMNIIIIYTAQFETSLICTQDVTKQQMIKISEELAEGLQKIL